MKKIKLLLAAIAAMVSLGANAQDWTSPGSDPVSGSSYYIYNVGVGQFLTGGNSWATQASLTNSGFSDAKNQPFLIKLEASDQNGGGFKFKLDGSFKTSGGNGRTDYTVNSTYIFRDSEQSAFVDYNNQNRGLIWTITKVDGTYRIQTAASDPVYPCAFIQYAAGSTPGAAVSFDNGLRAANIDWLFLTAEQAAASNLQDRAKLYVALMKAYNAGADVTEQVEVYEDSEATVEQMQAAVTALNTATYNAHLAKASDSDPRDITEYILANADFSINQNNYTTPTGWETNYISGSQASNIGFQGAKYKNGDVAISKFIEAWRSGNTAIGDGYLRQTVSGMPEGKYVLECDAIAVNQGNKSATTTGAYLFITADGSDYTASLSTGNEKPEHFSTQFLFTGEGDIIFGLKTATTTANWIAADNFKVTFYGIDLSAYATQLATEVATFEGLESSVEATVYAELATQVEALNKEYKSSKTYAAAIANMQTINAYATALAAAEAADADITYNNVTGTEQTALTTAIEDTPTYADYTTYADKTTALTAATAAFTAAATNYDALVREIAKAKALGISEATANAYAATSSSTAESVLASTKELMVAEYNYVATNYENEVDIDPANWNAIGDCGTMTSQHWSGDGTIVYYEQKEWGPVFNLEYNTTTSLPAGNYVFKVAGRKSSDAVAMTLTVAYDETTLTVSDFPNGDTGLGINKKGVTSFDAEDEDGFANSNNGRGWQWRYVKFTLADPAEVTLTVTGSTSVEYQWMGFCNASLLTDEADNVSLIEALVALNETINAATLTQHTNVGSGVFQLESATDGSLWSAYTTAKGNAEAFTLTSSSTPEEVTALNTALTEAIDNYNNNQVLNAPDAEKRYFVNIIDEDQDWDGNAITFIAGGRTGEGDYNVKYLAPANANLNQAIKFTAVAGKDNTYYVSVVRADGNEQYLTTAKLGYNKGNDEQIRTTNDVEKALEVKVLAVGDKVGEFQLQNTVAGKLIARNSSTPDNGVYTSGSANFTIAEASKAEIAINTKKAGWGTIILPFDGLEVPLGQKAYSCKEVDETTQTLTLVEVSALQANKPYILQGAWEETPTGWGLAGALTYTDGLLTGVYAKTAAPGGSYVLQNQEGKVGFYMVDLDYLEANEMSVPNVPANRAYLEVPAAGVKAFYFGDVETAIKSVFDGVAAGEVYDLNGRKVGSMQKGGAYIVNGKKVIIK